MDVSATEVMPAQAMPSQADGTRAESARRLVFLLFFVSGFAALMYQIVWQRALFAIYGINTQSVTVVVSAFMLGLGLGSLLGGYMSTLPIPLLPVFAAAELGTAAFGFVSLRLFNLVAVHTAGVNTAATAMLAFVLLLIPTMLMGSTLPVLVTYCVRMIPDMGRWTGGLYYVNTLGSAVACIVAALVTMRLLGESGCVLLAASINAAVGTAALLYHCRCKPGSSATAQQLPPLIMQTRSFLPFSLAVIVAGVGGVIALAYEIIWYRVFAFATATNSRDFAFVLGMYLTGIAFGSWLAEAICRCKQDLRARRLTTGLLILIGNVIAFAIAPAASFCVKATHAPILALPLVAVGSLLLGAIFPLICDLAIRPDARAGSGLSQLYFSNIIGSTVGSFAVGYVLMDFLSTAQVSLILVVCGTLLGLFVLAWKDPGLLKSAVAIAAVCVLMILGIWRLFPGMYERLLTGFPDMAKFDYLVESRSGVVGVLSDRTVVGGGAYDGRFNTDPIKDSNGIFRAYALSALHPAPKQVLMIGLSSGSWAQIIASNPYVEHLTVIEINHAYLSLVPRYAEVQSVLSNPKVTIAIDDGRRWLRRHPASQFDAVVMNTTFHWRASVTNLLSTEFLQLVRQHLKPGGIFYYNTTDSAEAQITGATVYPYTVRVLNFIAVSDSPILLDKQRWVEVMQQYRIDGSPVLAPARAAENQLLLSKYEHWVDEAHGGSAKQQIEYAETLRARYHDRTVITDDNMACEWRE